MYRVIGIALSQDATLDQLPYKDCRGLQAHLRPLIGKASGEDHQSRPGELVKMAGHTCTHSIWLALRRDGQN